MEVSENIIYIYIYERFSFESNSYGIMRVRGRGPHIQVVGIEYKYEDTHPYSQRIVRVTLIVM